jgi:hypothetical protein
MNEQKVADLFSEQLDRLLAGEAVVDIPGVADLPGLMTLGQQLSEVSFEPTPAAQAAFQNQVTTWFGLSGSDLVPTIFGMSKLKFLSLVAAIIAIGAGIGLVMLMGSWLFDDSSPDVDDELPAPLSTELPAGKTSEGLNSPVLGPGAGTETPRLATPETTPVAPTASLRDTFPGPTSSRGDTLPPPTSGRGDTLPAATTTPTPSSIWPTSDPGDTATNDNGDFDTDDDAGAPDGDHDRGHGNDPDGLDEDNSGKSSGLPDREDGGQSSNGAHPHHNRDGNSGGKKR